MLATNLLFKYFSLLILIMAALSEQCLVVKLYSWLGKHSANNFFMLEKALKNDGMRCSSCFLNKKN